MPRVCENQGGKSESGAFALKLAIPAYEQEMSHAE
jgi:hypothetical protein